MGDRGNIVFEMPQVGDSPKSRLFLYTHWGGSDLPAKLQAALGSKEGRGRWDDESYLARITLNHLQGNDRGETGFGIATYPPDNSHPYLVVDCLKHSVSVEAAPHADSTAPLIGKRWSFEEFIAEPAATFEHF